MTLLEVFREDPIPFLIFSAIAGEVFVRFSQAVLGALASILGPPVIKCRCACPGDSDEEE